MNTRPSAPRRHVPDPTDFGTTLCSRRRESGDAGVMFECVMAKPGETISCGYCRAVIAAIRNCVGPRYMLMRDIEAYT